MSLGGSDQVVVTGCHGCMGSLLSFGRNTYHGTDCSEWVWADSEERDVVREVSAPEGFSVGFVLGYFRSSKERGGQRLDVRDEARLGSAPVRIWGVGFPSGPTRCPELSISATHRAPPIPIASTAPICRSRVVASAHIVSSPPRAGSQTRPPRRRTEGGRCTLGTPGLETGTTPRPPWYAVNRPMRRLR